MKIFKAKQLCIVLFIMAVALSQCFGDVNLPNIFGDNMVLQGDMKIPVWGTSAAGEKITVILNGKTVKTTADQDGRWMVKLGKMKPGGPYEMRVTGNNIIVLRNVKIGEVWLCSGQSNMWWPVERLHDIPGDVAPADNPDIRLFSVWSPEHDSFGKTPEWVQCDTETVREFSAAAYFFGRYLQQELKVPVGLIHCSMGGSIPEAWMTRKNLISNPEFKPIVTSWDSITTVYPDAMARFNQYLSDLKKAKADGTQLPDAPTFEFVPKPLRIYMRYPQIVYGAQLKPLAPYGIKGVIWYQGESSAARSYQYRDLFPAMISEWREFWDQGNFPFLYVQLANYNGGSAQESIPELREAQLMALSVPNTGMAVTVDIGDNDNVHANNKWDVGYRLALLAFDKVYGRNLLSSGPIYTSMKITGNTIRLKFKHKGEGLVAGGNESLKGFVIAGKDRKFYNAKAQIEGDEVVVSSSNVS
ncbi:MAG: sialate O-acetylesterase, partial [Candidatus Latescibacteria bacterium]|nr:sialate O-acetylesterase [Candidatus Latescibacterota bacterium]